MLKENSQLRAEARQALQGKWPMAAVAALIYSIVAGGLSAIPFIGGLCSLFIGLPVAYGIAIVMFGVFKGKDVDYVGLGPFRFTTTKKNLAPEIGLEGYTEIVKDVRAAGVELPIVAIGGITEDDVKPLMATGVNGIAMSGAIIGADDPMLYTSSVMEKLLGIPGK